MDENNCDSCDSCHNNRELKKELDFYKSLFKTHNKSCLFNLHIKTINGEKLWVDRVRDTDKFHTLDIDDEVKEWSKPVKCER